MKGADKRKENWNSDTFIYRRNAADTEGLKKYEQNFVYEKETNLHQRTDKFLRVLKKSDQLRQYMWDLQLPTIQTSFSNQWF